MTGVGHGKNEREIIVAAFAEIFWRSRPYGWLTTGRVMVKVEPLPGMLSTSTVP